MSLVQNNLQSLGWFLPEFGLALGAMVIFILDLVWRNSARRVPLLAATTLLVLAATGVLLALQPTGARSLFNGMIANDSFAIFFKWLFLAAAFFTVLIALPARDLVSRRLGEFHGLLLAVVLGMFLMASATDLLMMYLAIEMVSLLSYVLTGFRKGDRKAAEASLKYVIYGGVASGIMLFGLSYIYGLLGTTNISQIAPRLVALNQIAVSPAGATALRLVLVVALVFVLCGIGYKIASVPWHMWCPDVYEGAPTPFTAFLSVGPKAAGFALALRLFYGSFAGPPSMSGLANVVADLPWPAIIGVLAAVTMTLGNITALVQTNLKRLLAYSSIAHAGYTLMGMAALSKLGMQSVMVYLVVYLVMNLGAFLVVIMVAHNTGSESIFDYRGLVRRQPLTAITFAVFLFSLTGLPPLAGFAGKWYLFVAVLQRAGGPDGGWYVTLAIIGAINTAIALYYYARVIRAMFLDEPVSVEPVRSPVGHSLMLGAFAAALLLFGLWWSPFVEWTQSSLVLFRG